MQNKCNHLNLVKTNTGYACNDCHELVNAFGISTRKEQPVIMEVIGEKGEVVGEYVDKGDKQKPKRFRITELRFRRDPAGVLNELSDPKRLIVHG